MDRLRPAQTSLPLSSDTTHQNRFSGFFFSLRPETIRTLHGGPLNFKKEMDDTGNFSPERPKSLNLVASEGSEIGFSQRQ
jgi:hypothetical protein